MRTAPPTTSSLPLTWGEPPVAHIAYRLGRVWADAHMRRRWGIGSRRQQMLVLGVVSVVLAFFAPQEGLLCVVGVLVFWIWSRWGLPLMPLRRLRAGVTARVPTTVRLDEEGVHQTGPDGAVHHRWHELEDARLRHGFLVLDDRERPAIAAALCLDHLGPGVEPQALLEEVRRRMAAAR